MSNVATAQKIEQPKTELKVVSKTDETKKGVKPTAKAPKATAEPQAQPKILTLEEIKRKNEVLSRLMERHESVSRKLKSVENFQISHDRDTATVLVTDASGESFESNSPKTIKQLIDFWKKEFNEALTALEEEIRANA